MEAVKPKVINISSHQLSDYELSILSKGFKFCSTPYKSDLLELETNIKDFVRKLQLKIQFGCVAHDYEPDDRSLVSKKGDYLPREDHDPLLRSLTNEMKSLAEDLDKIPVTPVFNNITTNERNAMISLSKK